jgi:hypothetical protein
MRIPSLLATLAFAAAGFVMPASAGPALDRATPAALAKAVSPEACLARAKGNHLAQLSCCKGHKGVCGCRAGKIVCCDNTASTEPGCTCHGDEAVVE